jgi:hypothetical protein
MASPSAKKPPARKAQNFELDEFAEKYENFAMIYGDPLEVVFKAMSEAQDPDEQLEAAKVLLSYRFPRIKAQETVDRSAPPVQFNITLMQPAPKVETSIDITPKPKELE